MALIISQGSGATIATDAIGGEHFSYSKIAGGGTGTANEWDILANGAGPVSVVGNVTITSGTVTIGSALPAGNNNIGNVDIVSGTVDTVTSITNDVNVADGGNSLTVDWLSGATVTPANTARTITGNVTLSDSKTFIGLVSVGGGVLNTITNVTNITNPIAIKGNLTLSDSKGFIGLVTVGNNVTIGNGMVTVTLGTQLDSTNDSVDIKSGATVTVNSAATIFAVVNTAAAGQSSVAIDGNVTLSDAKTFIGLVSVGGGTLNNVTTLGTVTNPIAIKGNLTLSDPKTFIGLNTSVIGSAATLFAVVNTSAPGQASVAIDGNVTLSDSKTFIGLVSVGGGTLNNVTTLGTITNPVALKGNLTLSDAKTFVGLVSVSGFTTPLPVDATGQGDVPITLAGEEVAVSGIKGNVTLSDAKTFIGLVSVGGGVLNTITAVTDITNPVALKGNVTIDSGTVSLSGNVTAWIAGPARTLAPFSIAMSTSSIATIAVPTNTFKITSMVLNSDATVRVSVKSGATYLTGNASIGITLNPGGGFVKDGTIDAPAFTGLADAEAIVIEKFDMTGTAANVGGYLSYYEA